MCSGRVFGVTANVASQSLLKNGLFNFFGRVRCGFCVVLLVVWRKTFTHVCGAGIAREGCSQVDVAQCQNQTGLIEF